MTHRRQNHAVDLLVGTDRPIDSIREVFAEALDRVRRLAGRLLEAGQDARDRILRVVEALKDRTRGM